MKLNTMTVPSMLPTAVCALPVSLPAPAAPWALLAAERSPAEFAPVMPVRVKLTVAALAPAAREHQVLTQAELGKATLALIGGNQGTTGFKGNGSTISSKRYTDGGSGVPPRGRPV